MLERVDLSGFRISVTLYTSESHASIMILRLIGNILNSVFQMYFILIVMGDASSSNAINIEQTLTYQCESFLMICTDTH